MIHSFQCCWLKGKERNCSWFGRLLRETFLEIQLSEPAQKYVLAGSCRQLICLAVFSFPVRRTNIHTGENTHWGRLLPFHLTCCFCPRTGTGWQFLQLSPDCKEVSRATDVGPLQWVQLLPSPRQTEADVLCPNCSYTEISYCDPRKDCKRNIKHQWP